MFDRSPGDAETDNAIISNIINGNHPKRESIPSIVLFLFMTNGKLRLLKPLAEFVGYEKH